MTLSKHAKMAFSLAEALVVLLIVSFCMTLFTFRPSNEMLEKIESRLFFDQVLAGLNLAQEVSVLQQTQVYVRFWHSLPYVQFQIVGQSASIQEVVIPDFWQIEQAFQFVYFPDGRTNQFDTVVFVHRDGHRAEIIFQLGSGKYELRQ